MYREQCEGPPFFLKPQLEIVRRIAFWLGLAGLPVFGARLLFPAFMIVLYLRMQWWSMFALVRCFSHVCCLTQQTCLLCQAVSAAAHSRHVCCVTQQTCLLCHTADVSAVPHRRHACGVTQQSAATLGPKGRLYLRLVSRSSLSNNEYRTF